MSMPRKVPCTVAGLTAHGGSVYTVDLAPERPLPTFLPGQFLHLTVEDFDPSGFWPESRVFSIASSPRDRSRVRICYAVKGRYTARMEERLKVGGRVWIKMPFGDFVVKPAPEVVLVAGGTGFAPFVPFLLGWAEDETATTQVRLLYGARSPALLLYREVVEVCGRCGDRFRGRLRSEAPPGAGDTILAGRLDLGDVRALCSDPESAVFYLSGPPAMLQYFQSGLCGQWGIDPGRVRVDAWA